ncbi:hypothetical protein M378DRAFT_164856 [Amanita muscaria Koide BX008]|uniref:Uncharacterized protein n=1 Tax=Amanita muscaria (strain Koide BX008) TaxID=946122 RepID=A0A0C2X372_AMAMK|nr:hypothetical protein M378DRAFT_164856 [Amanita muscaria Koide BX008]
MAMTNNKAVQGMDESHCIGGVLQQSKDTIQKGVSSRKIGQVQVTTVYSYTAQQRKDDSDGSHESRCRMN